MMRMVMCCVGAYHWWLVHLEDDLIEIRIREGSGGTAGGGVVLSSSIEAFDLLHRSIKVTVMKIERSVSIMRNGMDLYPKAHLLRSSSK
jgi:hypothetical protein